MNFEQLQQLWANQPAAHVPLMHAPALLEKIKADGAEFDRVIARRDRREILAGLFLLALYALPVRHPQGPSWAYWAAFGPVLAVTVGFLGLRWHAARKRREFPATLTGELAWSVYHTRHQIRLLTQVTWWYLLPLALGSFFHTFYRRGTFTFGSWTMNGAMLLTYVLVYLLNRRILRTKLHPQLEQLTKVQAQWETLGRDEGASPST